MNTVEKSPKWQKLLEPQQKILQHDNKRIAIRLEHEFWSQLETCAAGENRKLSTLVFDVLANAGESSNRAAVMRVFCIRWLRQRLIEAKQAAASSPDLQTVLSACPSPCVIMTVEKAIIAYNSAFARQIITGLAPEAGSKKKQGNMSLTFRLATPLKTIYDDLVSDTARYRDTKASFVQADKKIDSYARFCLIKSETGGKHPLLCYLMEPETAA